MRAACTLSFLCIVFCLYHPAASAQYLGETLPITSGDVHGHLGLGGDSDFQFNGSFVSIGPIEADADGFDGHISGATGAFNTVLSPDGFGSGETLDLGTLSGIRGYIQGTAGFGFSYTVPPPEPTCPNCDFLVSGSNVGFSGHLQAYYCGPIPQFSCNNRSTIELWALQVEGFGDMSAEVAAEGYPVDTRLTVTSGTATVTYLDPDMPEPSALLLTVVALAMLAFWGCRSVHTTSVSVNALRGR